jgi:hypothetical protein
MDEGKIYISINKYRNLRTQYTRNRMHKPIKIKIYICVCMIVFLWKM